MSLPGQIYGTEMDTRGQLGLPLGSHLIGSDLPELQGEFTPEAADLARMALSLAAEAPLALKPYAVNSSAGRPRTLGQPEDFLVPGHPLHDEALEILRQRQAFLAAKSGQLTVVG